MKQGDILLTYHKLDPLAWVIAYLSNGQFNHVLWAVNDHELIESVGKGIVISPLTKYLNWEYNLKLIRLKGLSQSKIELITKRLLAQQCNNFYLKYLMDYIIMIITRKPCRTTCSNFISYELIKEGYYINKKHFKFIVPEDFNVWKEADDVTNEL